MALNGVEQMMVAMLGKMGIDAEMVTSVANNVQATTVEMREGLKRVEYDTLRISKWMDLVTTKLDRLEILCDRILGDVTPTPAGGFELGDGSAEDLEFRKEMGDVIRPLPNAETLEYSQREDVVLDERVMRDERVDDQASGLLYADNSKVQPEG